MAPPPDATLSAPLSSALFSPSDQMMPMPGLDTEAHRPRFERLRLARRLAAVVSVFALVALLALRLRGSFDATPAVVLSALAALVAWSGAVVHTLRMHSARIDALLVATRLASVQAQIETATASRATIASAPSAGGDARPARTCVQGELTALHALAIDLEHRLGSIGDRIECTLVASTIAAGAGAVSLGAALASGLVSPWS